MNRLSNYYASCPRLAGTAPEEESFLERAEDFFKVLVVIGIIGASAAFAYKFIKDRHQRQVACRLNVSVVYPCQFWHASTHLLTTLFFVPVRSGPGGSGGAFRQKYAPLETDEFSKRPSKKSYTEKAEADAFSLEM